MAPPRGTPSRRGRTPMGMRTGGRGRTPTQRKGSAAPTTPVRPPSRGASLPTSPLAQHAGVQKRTSVSATAPSANTGSGSTIDKSWAELLRLQDMFGVTTDLPSVAPVPPHLKAPLAVPNDIAIPMVPTAQMFSPSVSDSETAVAHTSSAKHKAFLSTVAHVSPLSRPSTRAVREKKMVPDPPVVVSDSEVDEGDYIEDESQIGEGDDTEEVVEDSVPDGGLNSLGTRLVVQGGLSLGASVAERSVALAATFGAHVEDGSFQGDALASYPYKLPVRYGVSVAELAPAQAHLARAPGTYQVVCLRCSKSYSVAPSLQCVKAHPFANRCNQCIGKRSPTCQMVSIGPSFHVSQGANFSQVPLYAHGLLFQVQYWADKVQAAGGDAEARRSAAVHLDGHQALLIHVLEHPPSASPDKLKLMSDGLGVKDAAGVRRFANLATSISTDLFGAVQTLDAMQEGQNAKLVELLERQNALPVENLSATRAGSKAFASLDRAVR